MKAHPQPTRIRLGICVLAAVLGFSLLAFAGNAGLRRMPANAMGALAGPPISVAGLQGAIYVKFDGVDGETMDPAHKGWSTALSFDQAHSGTVSRTSGAGAGRVTFEGLLVTKELDKASPKLADGVCKGKVYPTAVIHVTRALGTNSLTYYKYELKNVLVSSYHVSGTGDAVPVEELMLSFEEIKVTYTEYDANGRSKGDTEYTCKT